ncbi:MAG: DUF3293 domain-containing protein [Burkholderiales bacterium]|jgi:hypothetical protein
MTVAKALQAAYLKTVYRVLGAAEPIDIRIGRCSPGLDRLLSQNGVTQWAFLTAANPRSQPLPDAENAQRNADMKRVLHEQGWYTLDAVGLPDDGAWQPEQSVLILGIDREAALEVARRWQQNAIVCGSIGQAAELAWVS